MSVFDSRVAEAKAQVVSLEGERSAAERAALQPRVEALAAAGWMVDEKTETVIVGRRVDGQLVEFRGSMVKVLGQAESYDVERGRRKPGSDEAGVIVAPYGDGTPERAAADALGMTPVEHQAFLRGLVPDAAA